MATLNISPSPKRDAFGLSPSHNAPLDIPATYALIKTGWTPPDSISRALDLLMISEGHNAQLEGTDYQTATWQAINGVHQPYWEYLCSINTEDSLGLLLEASPSPDCPCSACKRHQWMQ
jgi:hypothetical protein